MTAIAPLVALCALWIVAISGFAAVFGDSNWQGPLALAALGPIFIEWTVARLRATRPKSQGRTIRIGGNIAHLLGFFLVIGWTVFPDTVILGIPTPSTLAALVDGIQNALELARQSVPPIGSAPYLPIAALAVWWCAAASAAGLWSSGGSLLATAPPIAIYIAARVIADGNAGGMPVALLVVATVLTIVANDYSRIGADLPRIAAPAAVAVAAVVIGVFAGRLLPGYGEPALADWRNIVGTTIPDDPLVDIRSRLVDQSDRPVFTVSAPGGSYWRLTSVDSFDGRQFHNSDDPPVLPGPSESESERFRQNVTIIDLSSKWLPVAPFPDPDTDPRYYDPATSSLIVPGRTRNDVRYEVTSRVPDVGPEQLREVDFEPTEDMKHYLEAPELSKEIESWLADVTKGASTPYDKVIALQNAFLDMHYSLEPDPGHSGKDLERLILETQEGYCEQFATAMAVLSRRLGVPSRVAIGYIPGTVVDTNATGTRQTYLVRSNLAHAWPELYFPGYGWLPFEPTPQRGELNAPYLEPRDASSAGPDATASTTTAPPQEAPQEQPLPQLPEPSGSSGDPGSLLVRVLVALVVLSGLVIVGVPLLKRVRRRGRRQQAVRGAWEDAVDLGTDLGLAPRPSETPRELAERIRRDGDLDLAVLAEMYVDSAFMPPSGQGPEADAAWRIYDEARRAHARTHRRAALTAAFMPWSFLPKRWRPGAAAPPPTPPDERGRRQPDEREGERDGQRQPAEASVGAGSRG